MPESKSEFGSGQAVEPGVNFAGHSEPAEELAAEPEVVVDSAEAFVAQSDSDGGTNPIPEPEISAAEPVTESGPVASEPESELSIEELNPSSNPRPNLSQSRFPNPLRSPSQNPLPSWLSSPLRSPSSSFQPTPS